MLLIRHQKEYKASSFVESLGSIGDADRLDANEASSDRKSVVVGEMKQLPGRRKLSKDRQSGVREATSSTPTTTLVSAREAAVRLHCDEVQAKLISSHLKNKADTTNKGSSINSKVIKNKNC